MAAAVAANNKFIAADEVHKLIITSRQRISPPRVPVQTITDDLQHNGARLTDAGLLARLFARTRGLMRLRHRLHAYGYPSPAARYNLDSEGAHGFLRARNPKTQPSSSFAQERAEGDVYFDRERSLRRAVKSNIYMHRGRKV